jgi:hypothetical protein
MLIGLTSTCLGSPSVSQYEPFVTDPEWLTLSQTIHMDTLRHQKQPPRPRRLCPGRLCPHPPLDIRHNIRALNRLAFIGFAPFRTENMHSGVSC